MFSRRLFVVLLLAAAVWLVADVALACPTCKDQLAHDPEGANIARGYFWSILFMLSMPPLILSGLASYFYWEIRKARLQQSTQPAESVEFPPEDVHLPELA
jgi:heme/copper-type cytochrome/quinol oxidase subunit 2